MSDIIATTTSVCPQCLRRLSADLVAEGEGVIMVKTCPEHGIFRVTIWQGPPAFKTWLRPKIPYHGGARQSVANDGCPLDCGLCSAHNQRTCTALVEITGRCNLCCPVCFADSGHTGAAEPDLDRLAKRFSEIHTATGGCNLQLSGGEPTLHQDLADIIRAAGNAGFSFVQLNTNGLRFAEDPDLASRLRDAGLSSVFLQFDGMDDRVWRTLRGRDLMTIKERAVNRLAKAGLGLVLVMTVARGINDHQIWEICRYGLARQPAVRGVHLQPLSLFGRYPASWRPNHLTLPELMRMLVLQSGGTLGLDDFAPPGCEHALCSFSARYLNQENGRLYKLGEQTCTCNPQSAEAGALRAIDWTARQWRQPSVPGLSNRPEDDLDRFLTRARTHTFSISAMAFQDCWTLNLERLQGCCIHVSADDGRLIPFCAYNLTGLNGKSLYREKL